jgi:hypothetical protein
MNPVQTAHIRAHVAAVSKLLLGDRVMSPSLMILAGDPLNPLVRLEFGRTAVDSRVDLIYLEFVVDDAGVPVMAAIDLFLPRDTICYAWTGCRLSLLPGKNCAVIAPKDEVRGHFTVLPGEVVQVRSKPAALAAGMSRAAERILALVRDGVDVESQVVLREHAVL